ncbi:MAG: cohesin domain-containing protein [Saprospiraceae bacterium]
MLKKCIYCLLTLVLSFWRFGLMGQNSGNCLSFSIAEQVAMTGETACVAVTTKNFEAVISFQNTIQWDPSLLSLIEVKDFELGSVGSTFGVSAAQLALGRLPVSWFDPTLNGVTLADDELLYTLCFEVIGSENFAEIGFGNSPTPLEVTVESDNNFGLAPLPAAAISGGINIGDSDPSSLTIEEVCVQSNSCDESGLASITVNVLEGVAPYSYSWTGPGNFSATTANIVAEEAGFYELLVLDQNGASAKAVARVEEGAGSSDFVNGTVTNINCGTEDTGAISLNLTEAGSFEFNWSNGATSQNLSNLSAGEYAVTVTNSATGCTAVKTFQVSISQIQAGVFYTCLNTENEETGMAEVTAAVFSGGTGPFTFNWSTGEETVAESTSKIQVQLPTTVSVTITDQSNCLFVSQELSPTCQDNPQEDEFALSYSYTCIENDNTVDLSAFVWNGGNAPFTFNWSTGEQDTQNDKSTIRVSATGTYSLTVTDANGLIQVLGGMTPNCSANSPLHLSIGEANATTGETVCLAVRADGFNSLLGMQYAIGWDPSLVQLTTVQSFNLPHLSNTSFNLQPGQLEDGILRLSWFDAQTIGVTMPDGTALYEMCFTVLGTEGEASIYFDQNSMLTEFVNDGVSTVPPVLNNGLIIINGDERVWPGDTDHNALANHYDLLNIGIAYNATGPERPNANLTWTGQWATDWAGQTPASAINYKHIDANGDGLISAADTNGLSLNWGRTVNFNNDPFDEFRAIPGQPKNLTAPIFVEPYPVASGEIAHFNIHLGDTENPVEGAYGIAFTIVYDPLAVVYGSAKASFQPSWLGNIDDNMIAIVRDDPNHHRIHVALTRIDQVNVNGNGPIGMLSMTIEDVIFRDTEYEMLFRMENVRLISAQEQVINVEQRETSGMVNDSPLGIDDLPAAERIKLFPNPTTNQIQIEYNGIAAEYLQLFSPAGQLLREYKAMNQISLAGLPASTYLLRFVGKDGVYHKKVVKQ